MTQTDRKSVERWAVKGWNGDQIEYEDADGEWVKWEDYRALLDRAEEAEAKLAKAREALRVLLSNVETSEDVANEVWIEVSCRDVDHAFAILAEIGEQTND